MPLKQGMPQSLQHRSKSLRTSTPLLMTDDAGFALVFRPTTIAIHNHRYVLRQTVYDLDLRVTAAIRLTLGSSFNTERLTSMTRLQIQRVRLNRRSTISTRTISSD